MLLASEKEKINIYSNDRSLRKMFRVSNAHRLVNNFTNNFRQVQKSDRINSDRQSGSDQLGSTRTNSDRIKKKKKKKIELDSDQLGS